MTLEELLENIDDETLLEKAANLYPRKWDKEKKLWVYDHREALGLTDKDVDLIVHHKNGDEKDFSKGNLVAITRAEHARLEKPALKYEKCKLCGEKHFAKGYCQKHYKRIWRKALKKAIEK